MILRGQYAHGGQRRLAGHRGGQRVGVGDEPGRVEPGQPFVQVGERDQCGATQPSGDLLRTGRQVFIRGGRTFEHPDVLGQRDRPEGAQERGANVCARVVARRLGGQPLVVGEGGGTQLRFVGREQTDGGLHRFRSPG